MVTGFSRRKQSVGAPGPSRVVDARQRWKLSPEVRGALPTRWLREAYDQWRVGWKDGGRLIDRLNANERERLGLDARVHAQSPF